VNDVALALRRLGSGPLTVETPGGVEHELELTGTCHNGHAFYAEAVDRSADGVQYRLSAPVSEESGRIEVERRRARDPEWTALGPVVAARTDS